MIQGSQQLTPNCGTAYVMPAGLRAISAVRFTRSRTSQDVRFTREKMGTQSGRSRRRSDTLGSVRFTREKRGVYQATYSGEL